MNLQRYRVTGGGALFGLALVVTGAAAFLTANNLLFLIFSAMFALLLVSGFLSRLILSGLELELLLPEHVCARAATPARIRLRNLKRITPSFSIELAGRGDSAILRKPVYFPLVPGRAVVEAEVEVTFPVRGSHRDNLFVLSTRFPFGFVRRTTMVTLRRETVVYPAMHPTARIEEILAAATGEAETSVRGAGFDFYRIRPYLSSDSARMVDWKSTAHTGELQVREFAREERRLIEIYLDRYAKPEETAKFERALEECSFLVWHLAERQFAIRFLSQSCDLDEIFAILRYLALAQPLAFRDTLNRSETAEDWRSRDMMRIVIGANE